MRNAAGRIEKVPMVPVPDHIVRRVDCDSPDFASLVSKLVAELDERYPGLSDQEPAPPDLLVAVVAYSDGVPIGCGALRELEPGVGEIKRMYVVPEARGRGAARRILALLETQAMAFGYSAARLGTGLRQPEAVALYESCGYRPTALFGDYDDPLCRCYEKALG